MFFAILLVVFLLVCVFICLLILIQSDKGGGISGAIGGLSGANNFLGTQDTANVLTKGTYVFGAVFLVLCVLMTIFEPGGGGVKSGLQKRAERVQTVTPVPASAFGADGLIGDDAAAETAPDAAEGTPAE
jgi:preprotein translocase subunit SecG